MKRYIFNRVLQLIPIFLGVTFLTFCVMQLSMTDAVDIMFGDKGSVSAAAMEAKRAELGLNRHFLTQYFDWLLGVITFDFGKSYLTGKPVFEMFADKFPATFLLMLVSIALTLLIATPLGIIAAVKQNEKNDLIIRFLSFIGNSLPNFLVALLLIYILALKLNLFSVIGKTGLSGVMMPALTLAVAMGAKYTRQIRALFLEELGKPYVLGAKARGLSEFQILFKEVLGVAAPMITTLVALSVGSLLGGAAIVETVFMWDGVGKLAVDAALTRDYPVLEAYALLMSIIYVLVNLAADILQYRLDPRLRYGRKL